MTEEEWIKRTLERIQSIEDTLGKLQSYREEEKKEDVIEEEESQPTESGVEGSKMVDETQTDEGNVTMFMELMGKGGGKKGG